LSTRGGPTRFPPSKDGPHPGVNINGEDAKIAIISSFYLDGGEISVAKDPACPKVRGDGTARGLCGDITSGPSDNWITPDGAFLYQIYGNACRLVGYATHPDGSLREVTSVRIPYNSPQGLAGF